MESNGTLDQGVNGVARGVSFAVLGVTGISIHSKCYLFFQCPIEKATILLIDCTYSTQKC